MHESTPRGPTPSLPFRSATGRRLVRSIFDLGERCLKIYCTYTHRRLDRDKDEEQVITERQGGHQQVAVEMPHVSNNRTNDFLRLHRPCSWIWLFRSEPQLNFALLSLQPMELHFALSLFALLLPSALAGGVRASFHESLAPKRALVGQPKGALTYLPLLD